LPEAGLGLVIRETERASHEENRSQRAGVPSTAAGHLCAPTERSPSMGHFDPSSGKVGHILCLLFR
jgi:hypothetical protein